MPVYRYEAYSPDGLSKRGTVEAETEAHARKDLHKSGLRIVAIRISQDVRENNSFLKFSFRNRLNPERLFTDLSVLLEAGLGLERALKALADTEGNNTQAAKTLLASLSAGSSPSEAFRGLNVIPEETCALLAGGERTGKLATVFNMAALEMKRQRERNNQLFEAISYPAFLILMMVLAVLLITFSLVPAIQPVFESAGQKPPLIVSALGGLGEFLSQAGFLLLLAPLVIAILLASAKVRGKFSALMIEATFRAPIIGQLAKTYVLVRYLRSLSLSLANGVEMQHALALSAKTCSYQRYKSAFLSMRERVISGTTFPDAMSSTKIFPASVVSLASIGDAVNGLSTVLSRSADILDAEATRLQTRLLAALSPAITILMGLLIGSLVVSVMSALLSINEMSLQ